MLLNTATLTIKVTPEDLFAQRKSEIRVGESTSHRLQEGKGLLTVTRAVMSPQSHETPTILVQ
ncbi:hypothetical protein E2C01_027351 [Portunus trituberculatus]|uniref:Uncharacterized protein n=1 Tax=Portunus trituberculatus TaxID=210409 RepID=A0A5B7EHX5_PORTR|nr:hypothetical protein [Portunus trituberculatus]